MSPGALRSAKGRIAGRLRRLIREELNATLPQEADIEEELRYLMTTLAGAG